MKTIQIAQTVSLLILAIPYISVPAYAGLPTPFVMQEPIAKPQIVTSQVATSEEIYTKSLPSVMTLTVDKGEGKNSIGTAFMCVKEGVAVTAWHVVRDAKRVVAKFSTGEEFEVSGLIDKDEARDVALIRVKVFGRPSLPAVASDPQIGAKAFVIGSPKGLAFSFSDGLVSQIQMMEGVKQFQFTCAVSPGNSGGPLINAKGEVIGVVSWQVRDGQNLNFAVPISYVLGLDNSLPTQQWENVKASRPLSTDGTASTIDADPFDKLLADSLIMTRNLSLTIRCIDEKVVFRRFGFESGIPTESYALKTDAEGRITKLKGLTAPDKSREKWRLVEIDDLTRLVQRLDLTEKAVKTAQHSRGFTSEANEYLKQAQAATLTQPTVTLEKEDISVIKDSKVLKAVLPIDEQITFGLRANDAGYSLGIDSFPRNPLYMTLVFKGSVAEQIGIKEKDQVIGADGKQFDSVYDLKMFIKANLGKKVKVTVKRGEKIQDIELKIPSILPKSA